MREERFVSKKWDYALLSEEAKEHGGPDELRDYYESEGRTEGRTETAIVVVVITLIFLGGKWCYDRGRRYFNEKKIKNLLETAKSRIKEEMAKMECINCQKSLENGDFTAPWEDGDNSHAYVKCCNCGSENILEGYGEE